MIGLTDFEEFQAKLGTPGTLPYALLLAVLIGLIAWLVGRALALAFERLMDRPGHLRLPADRTALKFLAQLTRLGVYLFAFVTYANMVPQLRGLGTAWLASVGVVSVVLGLAAQNTLGNLIAGISLLLYRPFNLGDRLQVMAPSGLETGVVESLNLGYTILLTSDNRRVVIPNSLMASQTSVNISLTDERKLCSVPVRVNHEADVDKARQILIELVKAHPKTLEYHSCPVTELGKRQVTLTLRMWCANPQVAENLKFDILEGAKKQFEQAGVPLFRGKAGGKGTE
jgi:small conductance mechanosensitive channel